MSDGKLKKLKGLLVLFVIILFGISLFTDVQYGRLKSNQVDISKDAGELMVELPGQFIVAAFAGFKEVIAGALWVRVDSMFHEGQYQNIIPLVRLITWLDPHNIDVYSTGAWHMDYNFTDKNEISDKRMIPSSIALLEEGCKNNPKRYDLFMDIAWTHYYRKLEDYDKAIEWMEKARTKGWVDPNTGKLGPTPEFIDRMLAHMYEISGRYDKAIETWKQSIAYAKELEARGEETSGPFSAVTMSKRNLSLLYLRLGWRFGDMESYKKGLDLAKEAGNFEKWAVDGAQADYDKRFASNNPPTDAKKPFETKLTYKLTKLAPAYFEVKGTLNLIPWSEYKDLASETFTHAYQDNQAKPVALPSESYRASQLNKREIWRDGSRVKWIFMDKDYVMPVLKSFSWKIDRTKTCAWNSERVSNGEFKFNIDLRNNPDMYPLSAQEYKFIIMFDPRGQGSPEDIQDRIGWCGEALTGKDLDTKSFARTKIVKQEIILSRSDIL